MWYTRPDGSAGDSMTCVGALALIGGYDCAAHVRACQDSNGRMRRHPTMMDSSYSRDHVVSLCFYSLWSGDHEPLRKFLKYCLLRGGKFCEGSMGQSMLNPIVLSAILSVLGYSRLAWVLDVLNFPVLWLEAKKTKLGYRAILISEVCLIKIITNPKSFRRWIRYSKI